MSRQVGRSAAPALVSGVMYALAFPSFNFHILAWFALVPLFAVGRPRFQDGLLAGMVANLIIFFWLWKTFIAAHIALVTTFAVWMALALVLGLYFAVFTAIFGRLPNNVFRPFIAAVIWIALEQTRSVVLTGFPWALFAHTQWNNLPLLQWVSFTGDLGLSFLLIYVNAVIAGLLAGRSRAHIVSFVLTGFLVFGLWFIGGRIFAMREAAMEDARKIKVALLQGNIDQYQKWDAAYEAGIRTRYQQLVQAAIKSDPDLVVWPETSVPGWYPNDKIYVAWIKDVVSKSGVPHLIGAVTNRNGKDYNAAFLIDAQGEMVSEYDKRHMVPFGEYIPFGEIFKRWIPYLGQLGTFDAGDMPVLFQIGAVKAAPNICYEAFFQGLVAHGVEKGADVTVNITNDGWFLDTAAPEQHFVANIFRAVETGRPVVRAANTGISAVIDAAGKVRFRSALLVPGVFVVDVPLTNDATFFSMLYSRLCRAN